MGAALTRFCNGDEETVRPWVAARCDLEDVKADFRMGRELGQLIPTGCNRDGNYDGQT